MPVSANRDFEVGGDLDDRGELTGTVEADSDPASPQFVVRAGVASASQLRTGTRHSVNGHGFSVQTAPGMQVDDLTRGGQFPNRLISVTTIAKLGTIGITVNAPTPGAGAHHGTVVIPHIAPLGIFKAISRCFSQQTNPFITPRGG
jgi:hypothetical protein